MCIKYSIKQTISQRETTFSFPLEVRWGSELKSLWWDGSVLSLCHHSLSNYTGMVTLMVVTLNIWTAPALSCFSRYLKTCFNSFSLPSSQLPNIWIDGLLGYEYYPVYWLWFMAYSGRCALEFSSTEIKHLDTWW